MIKNEDRGKMHGGWKVTITREAVSRTLRITVLDVWTNRQCVTSVHESALNDSVADWTHILGAVIVNSFKHHWKERCK